MKDNMFCPFISAREILRICRKERCMLFVPERNYKGLITPAHCVMNQEIAIQGRTFGKPADDQ
jgi:hypothetical protein